MSRETEIRERRALGVSTITDVDCLLSVIDEQREQQGKLVEALRRLTFALESYEWGSTLPSEEFHAMINAAQDAIDKADGARTS